MSGAIDSSDNDAYMAGLRSLKGCEQILLPKESYMQYLQKHHLFTWAASLQSWHRAKKVTCHNEPDCELASLPIFWSPRFGAYKPFPDCRCRHGVIALFCPECPDGPFTWPAGIRPAPPMLGWPCRLPSTYMDDE